MTNKDINKNRLRDRICDRCQFKLTPDSFNHCVHLSLRPDENTCDKWSARGIITYRFSYLDNELKVER